MNSLFRHTIHANGIAVDTLSLQRCSSIGASKERLRSTKELLKCHEHSAGCMAQSCGAFRGTCRGASTILSPQTRDSSRPGPNAPMELEPSGCHAGQALGGMITRRSFRCRAACCGIACWRLRIRTGALLGESLTSANTTLGFLWAFRPHAWCISRDCPQFGGVSYRTTPKWCQIPVHPTRRHGRRQYCSAPVPEGRVFHDKFRAPRSQLPPGSGSNIFFAERFVVLSGEINLRCVPCCLAEALCVL